jgi:hypothetical protein
MEGVGEEDSGVNAFTVFDLVENPNAVRVNADIPIQMQVTVSPNKEKGEVFERVETHFVTYDKAGAPPLAPAQVTDISEEVAASLKLKQGRKLEMAGKKKRERMTQEELDAISSEE